MFGTRPLFARLQLVGRVISSGEMQKTAKVEVNRLVRHARTKKMINSRKRFLVHDEEGARLPGDVVRIEECRPLSKRKRFQIVELVQEAERITHPVTGKTITKMMV